MTTRKSTKKTEEDAPARNEQAPGFEEALERLEAMVAEMEEGSLSLEKMMDYFEKGQKLIAYCSAKLNEIERKIEILVRKDGKVIAEPFEETGAGEPETSDKTKSAGGSGDELF